VASQVTPPVSEVDREQASRGVLHTFALRQTCSADAPPGGKGVSGVDDLLEAPAGDRAERVASELHVLGHEPEARQAGIHPTAQKPQHHVAQVVESTIGLYRRVVIALKPSGDRCLGDVGTPPNLGAAQPELRSQQTDHGDPVVGRRTLPALGLLAEVINGGNTFSVPRFITLYTAAERYWKAPHPTQQWRPAQLAKTADMPQAVTGASKDAVSLIGASRNYHAHLEVGTRFSPERIIDETYESTRRLHALLQACLLRELGFDTANTERLLSQHYRNWPVP
jgi:hypothetical protein